MLQTACGRMECQLGGCALVEERGAEHVDGAELGEWQFLFIHRTLPRWIRR